MIVLALCCYVPMLAIGAPAYPVSWGHATLLLLIGGTVAGSLRMLTRETQSLTRRLREEAVIDDLTGLLNRRGWRHAAPRELARSSRNGVPIALVMLDLDNFKRLNDQQGHDRGDRALREVADWLRATLRAGDVVARIGGDEFLALLTNATLDGALVAVKRLRRAMPARASFSAGVAEWDGGEDLEELLRRVDLALYAAKAAGGSATEVAPAPLTAGLPVDSIQSGRGSVAEVG
jgi:diguanylate cyclase (GGDEF)-like protein